MQTSNFHTQTEFYDFIGRRELDVNDPVAIYREARMRQGEELARVIHVAARAIARPFRGLWARYQAWQSYRVAYEELASLSERELADIGLTKGDIEQVAHGDWQPAGREERPTAALAPATGNMPHPTAPKLAA